MAESSVCVALRSSLCSSLFFSFWLFSGDDGSMEDDGGWVMPASKPASREKNERTLFIVSAASRLMRPILSPAQKRAITYVIHPSTVQVQVQTDRRADIRECVGRVRKTDRCDTY
jgi:hypothetical protein